MDRQVKSDDPGSLRLSRKGNGVGPEPPSPSGAHLPPPANGILELLGTLNYSPRGRGEGWAGPPANQRPGNPGEAGLPETTWLLFLDLTVLVLSSDTREGPSVLSRGSGSACKCLEKRVTVTRSPEEIPAHKQTSSASESRGTGSPSGPRGPIESQRVSLVATGIPFALPLKAGKRDPSAEEPRVPGTKRRKGTAPHK